MKSAVILVALAVFIVSGCKGKEEKQPVAGSPSTEQQGQAAPSSPAPESAQTGVPSPTPPDVLADTPPKIVSLKLTPDRVVVGDKIKAEVETFDKEGDPVSIAYQWSKNDIALFNESDTLSLGGDFKRGDKITLRVVPNDGKRTGNPVSVEMAIFNAPPVIKQSSETFRFDGSVYTYQVMATDPDGDTLTYALKSAPQGMTIDPATGMIRWNVPADFKGSAPVTVSVNDGHGGETMQSFSLDIRPEAKR